MNPKDIDHIITLINKINKLHFKDFSDRNKKWHYLDKYASPLEKELELFLAPRWKELVELSDNPKFLDFIGELHIHPTHLHAPPFPPRTEQQAEEGRRIKRKEVSSLVIQKLNCIKATLKYQITEQKTGGGGEGQKKKIWFISWSIAFIKSAYHITIKAITEAMMDKMNK